MWNYKLGLEKGWSPKDPRDATGVCASLDVTATNQFDGTFPAWHTGGAGAGESVSTRNAWPPASFADVPAAQVRASPSLGVLLLHFLSLD
jgi:glucan 1,3-beta-glucosidase